MEPDTDTPGRIGQLDWLLDDLVRRVGPIGKAVILSADGIALGASSTLEREDAEHLAALAAGFQSLARGAGRHFGGGPSSGPTPAEIRRSVSSLQRGWQEGRSRHGSPSEPLPGPGFSPSAGGGHDSTADEQAGGEADGT